MSHLLDDEDDDLRAPRERELTLSTSAILGIFFGLVLLCGLFFAFGYNMGSHKSVPSSDSDSSSSNPNPTTNFSAFKPAAGSPAASSSAANNVVYPSAPVSASSGSSTTDSTHISPAATTPAPIVRTAPPAPVEHVITPPPATSVQTPATGTFMVQVAAVSHQEDADLLVSALKGKGYAVAARPNPSDQLIHIQVGPFNNRKDADAMRQRLLNDGYNAILK